MPGKLGTGAVVVQKSIFLCVFPPRIVNDWNPSSQNYIARCDCVDLALYLFLITVSDAQGLSYYSDQGICRHLRIEPAAWVHLQKAELVAYQKPLYQVLALGQASEAAPSPTSRRTGEVQSISQILGRALKGGAA